MPELDWETVEIDAIREEDFWDLLTSAAADVQEVALSVWNQSANSDVGFGYASIAELVADPGDTMPMKNRLKFFRRKIQVLRKQAHLLSSRQTSGNETSGHLQHRAFQQRLPTQGPFHSECANNYGVISIYPGSAGPRSVSDAQSIAFGGRLYPSQNENRHLPHYDFQQRPQTHGPFHSECANDYGGPIYPGSAGENRHLPHYDFQPRPQTYGPFHSECANDYGGPIYPGSAGDRSQSFSAAQSVSIDGSRHHWQSRNFSHQTFHINPNKSSFRDQTMFLRGHVQNCSRSTRDNLPAFFCPKRADPARFFQEMS